MHLDLNHFTHINFIILLVTSGPALLQQYPTLSHVVMKSVVGVNVPSVDCSDFILDSLQVGVVPCLTIVDCAQIGCVHISPVGGDHGTATGEGQWIGLLASCGTPYSYVAIIKELHSDKEINSKTSSTASTYVQCVCIN